MMNTCSVQDLKSRMDVCLSLRFEPKISERSVVVLTRERSNGTVALLQNNNIRYYSKMEAGQKFGTQT